mmetsp:Transcript_25780/g.29472  ORF Transcript_25780/g.29472 Transcript_25780/m.29472 type:complete len:243 (+) Transcript_25780:133-861(+)|eukprot:CAMPEP_0194155718 /NCGR_PEP_ID=MMETSP0152-20130528/65645_1 /TAXON_ID=1049557 /ORGANISM="Thalassiothrix antarctica, Strain L6-D1" /LENGTH=242 /DNA_ID=CAMNT_0038862835 /DNA_START=62 /DNA_END=790 /DNA_ORIENTATION=+
MKSIIFFLFSPLVAIKAFFPSSITAIRPYYSTLLALGSYDDIYDIGYDVSVSKPLGIIFGENRDPYGGIVIDDVEPGLNGGTVGMRIGDQLVSINGQSCVGGDFNDIMELLKETDGELELQLYRGSVSLLYKILENRGVEAEEDEEKDEEEEELTEDYESPVVVNVEDYKPLTAGDFVKAFKNVGKMITEDNQSSPAKAQKSEKPKEERKKSGGIFGMFKQETIQLEGDEASGVNGQKRNQD